MTLNDLQGAAIGASVLTIALCIAVPAGRAAATDADDVHFGPPIRLSTTGGGAATKGRLLRLSYPAPGGTYETALVVIYGDAVGPPVWDHAGEVHAAQDLFATRSTDDGQTWSEPVNLSCSALLSSIDVDHDGVPSTPPVPYHGDSSKATIFGNGRNVLVAWGDAFCPTGRQRVVKYDEAGGHEVPYRALHVVRSVDGGASWGPPERLTDGTRDVAQITPRGNGKAWIVTWQEDPFGLQPGEGEGPGDGGSGAKTSRGTDIWWAAQSASEFKSFKSFPAGRRLTDNFTTTTTVGGVAYDDGVVGASRANVALVGDHAIVAYEEGKGTGEMAAGKYVRYHHFTPLSAAVPDLTGGVGWIVSDVNEHARRPRVVARASGSNDELTLVLLYRQGRQGMGGPADIMLRTGRKGYDPRHLVPAVDPDAATVEGAARNAPALNVSSLAGLDAATDADPSENARAHRAVIVGDRIALGFVRTEDWLAAEYANFAHYDYFVRFSVNAGTTWSWPRNLSRVADPRISVSEPRLLKVPGSPDPSETQAPMVIFAAWGTQWSKAWLQPTPIDLSVRRSSDWALTFGPAVPFADGPAPQRETQIRCAPDGRRVFVIWQEELEDGGSATMFRAGAVP